MGKVKLVQKENGRKAAVSTSSSSVTSNPKFPYSTTPNSIRKFLELVPRKPRPTKVNGETLRAWGLRNTNDQTIIRVLKALGLVTSNNEPTERYTEFMTPEKGPSVLAGAIKEVWAPIFDHSHEPHREDESTLRNYFHIYSGGGERAIQYQIQTYKAVCDYADFKGEAPKAPIKSVAATGQAVKAEVAGNGNAAIHIDLHIHLPENKSRRDYEYIFEDIARYIFGREMGGHSDDQS